MNDQAWESPPRAWAEVDLDAMKQNLMVAREIGGTDVMMVVKAGAYGHGLEAVVRAMDGEGVVFFGVANVGEARRISRVGVKTRIYLLGPTWSGERREITEQGWTPCLSTLEEAYDFEQLAAQIGRVLKVHLALDTGMGRGGFLPETIIEAMGTFGRLRHLDIEGIGSHLPCADEDEEFTREQIASFRKVLDLLGGNARFRWRHLLNSAGLMSYCSAACNLSRPGLMLYGISPVANYQERLRPVMTLKSRVSLVRTLPAGHGVSYGRQFITQTATRVATVGIGYGDGYPRHLSGQGAEVWLGGQRCPVLGRVTMDQIMVNVSGLDVIEGDEVELFGKHIPADEIAAKAGTIVWEVFTGITPRVVRVYHGK